MELRATLLPMRKWSRRLRKVGCPRRKVEKFEGYECISWSDASSTEERSRLWKARHALWFAFSSQFGKSGQKPYATDVCVPIDKLDLMISRAAEILDNSYAKGQYGMLGHVGDGNFHIILPGNHLNASN